MAARKTTRKAAAKPAASTDVQASPTFAPFQGERGASYGFTLGDGSARELEADRNGVIHPQRAEDVAFLSAHGLTAIQGGKAASKAAAQPEPDNHPPVVAVRNTGTSGETDEERTKAAAEDAALAQADADAAANTAEAEKES